MAATQTLQTIISINAKTGNGFLEVGATLSELGSMVNSISQKLIDFGKESLDVYQDYEKSMKDAEVALSTTYGRGTTELSTVMSGLDEAATEWAANTIFHTNDVANAISEAAHAGWDYEHIMSGLPAAMELAQAGGLDLSEAVNYIVKSTNAAGVGFEDMSNFIDLWTFAANSSASTVGEFGDAMLRMGSTMRFAGNTKELMTLIAVTANAGSTGAEAGTLIRNSIMRLIAPTKKAKEAMSVLGATSEETAELMDDQALAAANATLAAHGFSVFDEKGQLRNILDIYDSLYDSLVDVTGGLDDIDEISRNQTAVDILSAIFPTRTITEALTLLRGAKEEYGGLYEAMENGAAEGYGQYAAETQMDTLYGKVETFGSKVERVKQRVGEELSEPYEDLLGWLGEIADTVSGMDDTSFSMLVSAAEKIALAGPGLMAAGAALRTIGLIATPAGAAAAAIIGLAAAYGALEVSTRADLEGHFGTASLDLQTLKLQVDNLTTEAEEQMEYLQGYVDQINSLADQYKTALENFTTTTTTYTIAGKTLSPEEKDALIEQGKQMRDLIIEGINTAEEGSKQFLNIATPDQFATQEDYDEYSKAYDALGGYFADLREQAASLGEELNNTLVEAMGDDSQLDEWEQQKIQTITEKMANIQKTIAQADQYAELERASRVSFDDFEEYMTYLSDSYEGKKTELEQNIDTQMAYARLAYENELGHSLTDEEWFNSDRYKVYGGYVHDSVGDLDTQYGELMQTAFASAMGNADYGDVFSLVNSIVKNLPQNEKGKYDYSKIDWGKLISEGQLPQGFYSTIDELQKGGGAIGFIAGLAGIEGVNSPYAKLLETWKNNPLMEDTYNLFGGEKALEGIQQSYYDYLTDTTRVGYSFDADTPGQYIDNATGKQVGMAQATGMNQTVQGGEGSVTLDAELNVDTQSAQEQVDSAEPLTVQAETELEPLETEAEPVEVPVTYNAEEFETNVDPVEVPVEANPPEVTATVNADTSAFENTIDWVKNLPVPVDLVPYVKDTDAASSLAGQGVNVTVDGDVTQLTAKINGEDGQDLVSYVDGDVTDLNAKIMGEDGKTLVEIVHGDSTELANAINQYQGHVITVQVRAAGLLSGGIGAAGFAEGGRATSASIFGEAGPEWAIPEEHSKRTADLLNAARQASGFTWPELLSAYGGLNADANHKDTTVIYSPTVYANDATGVDRVLKDDKRRLDEWFEERKLRDRMEVYR